MNDQVVVLSCGDDSRTKAKDEDFFSGDYSCSVR